MKQNNSQNEISRPEKVETDVAEQIEIASIPSTSHESLVNDSIIIDTVSVETETLFSVNSSNNVLELFDIYDPGQWPNIISTEQFDNIIQKGPLQVTNFGFPLNSDRRHFSSKLYKRILTNGEEVSRRWLVYSKSTNRAYCFCCKLFRNVSGSKLASEGYNNWKNIIERLHNHEASPGHAVNVKNWIECETRLTKGSTVDEAHFRMIMKEKEHWRNVLKRIISVIKYLAQHNIAFRGSNCKLYERNNGNFLGLVEMLATFDPAMQEHVRRLKSSEIHDHYLGGHIQNELIKLMSQKITEKNVVDIEAAKYFSVLLDYSGPQPPRAIIFGD